MCFSSFQREVDFYFSTVMCQTSNKRKPTLHLYIAVSCLQEEAPAISSWVVSTNYLDFDLE